MTDYCFTVKHSIIINCLKNCDYFLAGGHEWHSRWITMTNDGNFNNTRQVSHKKEKKKTQVNNKKTKLETKTSK